MYMCVYVCMWTVTILTAVNSMHAVLHNYGINTKNMEYLDMHVQVLDQVHH